MSMSVHIDWLTTEKSRWQKQKYPKKKLDLKIWMYCERLSLTSVSCPFLNMDGRTLNIHFGYICEDLVLGCNVKLV